MDYLNFDTLLYHGELHCSISVVLWLLVLFAILLDLWDGVYTARQLRQRVHSHKLRVTVKKVSEYWRFMLIAFVIDTVGILFPIYALPYISILFCIGLVGVEAKSMLEHAKKRKSKAIEMEEIIKMVIDSATKPDAKETILRIRDFLEMKPNSNETN